MLAGQALEGAQQSHLASVFGWDTTGEVAARIGGVISHSLVGSPPQTLATVDRLLTVAGDARLVAEYLRALRAGDKTTVELLERISLEPDRRLRGQLRYELGRSLFGVSDPSLVVAIGGLKEILAGSDVDLCAENDEARPVLEQLINDMGPSLGAFIENQHEVPGPNARVRQGVVKTWHLPDGTRVASKRRNPLKPARFTLEQQNWSAVADRIGAEADRRLLSGGNADRSDVAVVPRLGLIRDRGSGEVYAISRWIDGTSVEMLLHELPAGPRRADVLHGYRELLDFLFDRGILWGDLSPRNVLVDDDAGRRTYWLVDFEKTAIIAAPVPHRARVDFCRGQVGVEELGVLCSRAELEHVLAGYFSPASWDVTSSAPPSFGTRPEVTATLRARRIEDPTEGEYNSADLEILDVRAPDRDPETGKRRLVGLVGFRVEHYLSCAHWKSAGDYEARTTEILIAARRAGCFDPVWRVLADAAGRVERAFAVNEFLSVLERRGFESLTRVPDAAVRDLAELIDDLYARRAEPSVLRAFAIGRSSAVGSW